MKLSPDEGLFINKIYSKSCPQILSYIIYWKIAIVPRLLLAMLVQNLNFKQYQMFHSDNIIFQIDSRNMSWLFLEWVSESQARTGVRRCRSQARTEGGKLKLDKLFLGWIFQKMSAGPHKLIKCARKVIYKYLKYLWFNYMEDLARYSKSWYILTNSQSYVYLGAWVLIRCEEMSIIFPSQ